MMKVSVHPQKSNKELMKLIESEHFQKMLKGIADAYKKSRKKQLEMLNCPKCQFEQYDKKTGKCGNCGYLSASSS